MALCGDTPQRAHRFATSDQLSESDPLARKNPINDKDLSGPLTSSGGLLTDSALAKEILLLSCRCRGGQP